MATYLQALRQRVGRFTAGRQPTPPPKPFAEMGASGTAVWGGYVQVKERSPEWIGRQKYITSSELAINTSIVAASVHYFLNLVAYPAWTFRAADEDDEESLALAEFTQDVMNDMDTPWYNVVRRAAMYRFHGFGLQEWTAKHRDDGLIGFKDIESRPQHTIEQWDVDETGKVLGVWQRSTQTGAMLGIPRDKMLYLVEDTLTDSPEGIGVFRHMADPYQRLKQMQALEIRAFERDLRGTPIARAPLTMLDRAVSQNVITEAEAQAMVRDFQSLVTLQVKQSDTGIVMDSLPYFSDSDAGDQVSAVPQWNFELLSGAGVGHAEIAAAIDRVQREMARMVGTEHLMMGDVGGNRSLAEDKSRNLYLISNSVLKYVAARVKSDILIPLWRLNGFPMNKMPEPKPEDVTFKNVDAITNAIGKMASAGAVLAPTDPVINDVRDLLGVSRVPDEVMQQATGAQNPMLAGLPPQLQMPGAQLNGQGGPIRIGAGGPGKQPGMGGGALPGQGGFDPTKKFRKRPPFDIEQDEEDEEQAPTDEMGNPLQQREEQSTQQAEGTPDQPQGVKPANAVDAAPSAEDAMAQIDINGAKPGGNIEIPQSLVISLLQRLAGASAEQAPMADPHVSPGGKPTPAGHPNAQPADEVKDQLPAGKPQEGADAETDRKEMQSPGGPQLRPDERPVVGPDAKQPQPKGGVGDPKAVGAKAPVGADIDPKVRPLPAGGKRPAGLSGDPKAKKPILGAAADTQFATKPAGKPVAGKPQQTAPGQPPVPGQPASEPQVDPKTGKPIDPTQPGADQAAAAQLQGAGDMGPGNQVPPTPAKPEMTPERASEVLQPYADHSMTPEEDSLQDEADMLWTRLGDEKDVGPVGADEEAKALEQEAQAFENEDTAEQGLPGLQQLEQQPDAEVDPAAEEQTRARLRTRLDMEDEPERPEQPLQPNPERVVRERLRERLDVEDEPKPKVVPKKLKRLRL